MLDISDRSTPLIVLHFVFVLLQEHTTHKTYFYTFSIIDQIEFFIANLCVMIWNFIGAFSKVFMLQLAYILSPPKFYQ